MKVTTVTLTKSQKLDSSVQYLECRYALTIACYQVIYDVLIVHDMVNQVLHFPC